MSKKLQLVTESSSLVESSKFAPKEAAQGEILEQLTHDEQCDRLQLELVVGQAFYQTGKALAELRQRRLYRSTHRTFEAYCQDKFGFSRRYSDYLIAGTVVVENLQQMRTIHSQTQLNEQNEFNENMRTSHAQILPTNVEQTKFLASLKPDEQRQVWDKAVKTAHGKVPSGRTIKEIVEEQLKEKPPVLTQDDWNVGDVFILVRLKGKERKYNGCCCVAVKLTDWTVIVDVHDATITVNLENLTKIDSLDLKRQLSQTLKRIIQLRKIGSLDRGADNFLKDLTKHTALTPVEEGLLSWLEKYYNIYEQESRFYQQ